MESLVVDPMFWRNKRVLLTGHTGFKGGWLALWLQKMQAQVVGLALPPITKPNLFEAARVAENMQSLMGDITNFVRIQEVFQKIKPEVVFHMAAQPLVRYSYLHPLETYQTNVMGTLHILEAIRNTASVKAVVLVSTDKCYQNRERSLRYIENDILGGHDPYSSSKACMELLASSYRQSYFLDESAPAVATVRAGNVIGGGDWAEDRLLPDLIRANQANQTIFLRNPDSVRPWQHVLEPLSGYLRLAERLFVDGESFAEAWNFGPDGDSDKTVRCIVEQVVNFWPDLKMEIQPGAHPHETQILKLECNKARERLKWQGRWQLSQAIDKTLEWHQQHINGSDMKQFCFKQIDDYLCTEGYQA